MTRGSQIHAAVLCRNRQATASTSTGLAEVDDGVQVDALEALPAAVVEEPGAEDAVGQRCRGRPAG